jgi:hypothetical protein
MLLCEADIHIHLQTLTLTKMRKSVFQIQRLLSKMLMKCTSKANESAEVAYYKSLAKHADKDAKEVQYQG